MDNFLNIAIVGGALSVAIQIIKDKVGAEGTNAKLLTIGLSVLVGSIYVYLEQTGLLVTVMGILGAASAVYALVMKK